MFEIKRREFMALLAGATVAGPRAALAQMSSKVFHLGTLTPGAPLDEKSPLGAILVKALEKRGYIISKNLTFEAQGLAAK
jgi:putative tryptophan/tyrosine transport system substrate-binding protein